MNTVTYPLRLDETTFRRVKMEARRRHKSVEEICREAISLGLKQMPLLPDTELTSVVADTWEKLGPAPEIDYGKL